MRKYLLILFLFVSVYALKSCNSKGEDTIAPDVSENPVNLPKLTELNINVTTSINPTTGKPTTKAWATVLPDSARIYKSVQFTVNGEVVPYDEKSKRLNKESLAQAYDAGKECQIIFKYDKFIYTRKVVIPDVCVGSAKPVVQNNEPRTNLFIDINALKHKPNLVMISFTKHSYMIPIAVSNKNIDIFLLPNAVKPDETDIILTSLLSNPIKEISEKSLCMVGNITSFKIEGK